MPGAWPTTWLSLTPRATAINSNLASVPIAYSGSTCDLDARDDWCSRLPHKLVGTHLKRCARSVLSQRLCSLGIGEYEYLPVRGALETISLSDRFSLIRSWQSTTLNHVSFRRTFACIVYGVNKPRGSNRVSIFFRKLRFVWFYLSEGWLIWKLNKSSMGHYRTPKA